MCAKHRVILGDCVLQVVEGFFEEQYCLWKQPVIGICQSLHTCQAFVVAALCWFMLSYGMGNPAEVSIQGMQEMGLNAKGSAGHGG